MERDSVLHTDFTSIVDMKSKRFIVECTGGKNEVRAVQPGIHIQIQNYIHVAGCMIQNQNQVNPDSTVEFICYANAYSFGQSIHPGDNNRKSIPTIVLNAPDDKFVFSIYISPACLHASQSIQQKHCALLVSGYNCTTRCPCIRTFTPQSSQPFTGSGATMRAQQSHPINTGSQDGNNGTVTNVAATVFQLISALVDNRAKLKAEQDRVTDITTRYSELYENIQKRVPQNTFDDNAAVAGMSVRFHSRFEYGAT